MACRERLVPEPPRSRTAGGKERRANLAREEASWGTAESGRAWSPFDQGPRGGGSPNYLPEYNRVSGLDQTSFNELAQDVIDLLVQKLDTALEVRKLVAGQRAC